MVSIHLHFPKPRYSASAGDVNFKNSLSAPAIVMPGISHVSVYEITSENVNCFFSRELMKSIWEEAVEKAVDEQQRKFLSQETFIEWRSL